MEERKFEKQVKERMDELKIQPSEDVWQKVAAAIAEKKHRRWPVIILFFILFAGAGYMFWNTAVKHVPEKLNTDQKPAIANLLKPSATVLSKNTHLNNTTTDPRSALPVKNTTGKNNTPSFFYQHKKLQQLIKKSAPDTKATFSSFIINKMDTTEVNKKDSEIAKEENIAGLSDNYSAIVLKDTMRLQPNKDSLSQGKTGTNFIKNNARISQKNSTAKAQHKSNMWKFGVTLVPGISSVKNKLLYASGQNSSLSYPGNLGGTYNNPGTYSSVNFHPGFGFIAGIVAQKKIFKSIQFVTGINYTMLSVSNSLPDSVLGLYSANHVQHFSNLEIPIAVKFEFTIAKLPIFIQPGIALLQLIAAKHVTAFSDFNTTHINFTTSAGISLLSKSKHPLVAGPYVSYQAGSIADKGLYKGQHFFFAGLRTVFFIINK